MVFGALCDLVLADGLNSLYDPRVLFHARRTSCTNPGVVIIAVHNIICIYMYNEVFYAFRCTHGEYMVEYFSY